ncbi:hypothetical protein KEC55_25025 [Burkholderia cepacia]|uniref:hypothetical protein n=1 Tax=Burkholderia cepacia TaxID=292 RepID=UPI00249E2540|nr:hypothetical protein [Burkholderia cepacia]WGY70308.1 hypothetical protein KEC55_25025 [Burkholderia cepacia]
MASRKQLNGLLEAQKKRREELARLAARKPAARPRAVTKPPKPLQQSEPVSPPRAPEPPPVLPRTREALISLYQDDSIQPSEPSSALVSLADLYLHAAQYRSRHIAMVWPATLKTLTVVHALATLARWHEGDKQGVRGTLYPAKTNVFYRLNHLHFDRRSLLHIASDLAEVNGNPKVTRPMRDKDAFLFSLADGGLPQVPGEAFNPTIGELLPLFLATPDSNSWSACNARLLALVRAKLARRAHAKALQMNCAVIGDPRTAPDALFALDGRMTEEELRKACKALAKLGPPEVVLVQATRAVRFEAPGWKRHLARFCLMLEDVFQSAMPGVVVVTDEPHAAYRLKDELWERNHKRDPQHRWDMRHEFRIAGIPSTVGNEGLLAAGTCEAAHPSPREFDVHIVDADAAKVANRLVRIASAAPGGQAAAKPLADAATFLSRLAALPCGVRHMSEYLAGPDVTDRTRREFDWPTHFGAALEFNRSVGVGDDRPALLDCLERGSKLFGNYQAATPFAHKLAALVANAATRKKRSVAIVFPNALYRRLAERFLAEYDQYPSGVTYDAFGDRVHLLPAAQLDEHIDGLHGATLVFAGLNEDCLRVLLTDDRVPAHSVLLLTQRAGQFLRATLKPIVERMPEFKSYKPRMESILRQLKELPEDASVLSTGDYVLPTFRVELSSDISPHEQEVDPDSWGIRFDNGLTQYRRGTSDVYVYEPASQNATDAGFRTCQVRSLEVGDRVFVMSAELREMVEQVLCEAGVSIQSDKTFESALRSYHELVQKRLAHRFPQATVADKVRAVRQSMLELDASLERRLPTLQAMRHWIDLGRSPDTPFEQLRPQAPNREDVFKAFAEVLGFSSLEAAYHWQRVIMAVRTSRRLDGRHVSDIYAYMLLQPESVMAHSSIRRKTLHQLFDKARENVATVEIVGPLKESKE